MLTDSDHTDLLIEDERPAGRMLLAALCAILLTASVIAGYAYLRKRHAQQMQAIAAPTESAANNVPKGPPKANIAVDDAFVKAGQTVIGGTVKNTSNEKLTGLSVELELRRRKDASLEQTVVPVQPPELEPGQEGQYVLKLAQQDYSSVRLLGLRGGLLASPVAYTTTQGSKRPPERLEPKVVTVPRPASRGGDFLNTPDNPSRVP